MLTGAIHSELDDHTAIIDTTMVCTAIICAMIIHCRTHIRPQGKMVTLHCSPEMASGLCSAWLCPDHQFVDLQLSNLCADRWRLPQIHGPK